MSQIEFSEILLPLALVMAASAFVYLLLYVITRDQARSAIMLSLFLFLFFSFGHVYRRVAYTIPQQEYLLATYALLFIISFLIVSRWDRGKKYLSSFLAVFGKVLTAVLTVSLAINFFAMKNEVYADPEESFLVHNGTNRPDIYYIILDEYAGLNQIKNVYGFDNSAFVNRLVKKGFFVARDSTVKVPASQYSIATSLNMRYPREKSNPYRMIRQNKVSRYLKTLGYRYIHFGSWWLATSRNKLADRNVNLSIHGEVITTLLANSLLRSLFFSGTLARQDSVLNTFERMAEFPETDTAGPKYVFAHIICPHEPFLFGPHGEEIPLKDRANWDNKSVYLGQYIFITKKIEALVDTILASSKTPPAIIIQSDHGVRRFEGSHEILNAYYLPHGGNRLLWDSISPVNTFRVIFNHYFGTHFPILPEV